MQYLGSLNSNNSQNNTIIINTNDIINLLKPTSYNDYKHIILCAKGDINVDNFNANLVAEKGELGSLTNLRFVQTFAKDYTAFSSMLKIDSYVPLSNPNLIIDIEFDNNFNMCTTTIKFEGDETGDIQIAIEHPKVIFSTSNSFTQFNYDADVSLINKVINLFNDDTAEFIIKGVCDEQLDSTISVSLGNSIDEFIKSFSTWHLFAEK